MSADGFLPLSCDVLCAENQTGWYWAGGRRHWFHARKPLCGASIRIPKGTPTHKVNPHAGHVTDSDCSRCVAQMMRDEVAR